MQPVKVGWVLMLILGVYRLAWSFILPATGYDVGMSMLLGANAVAIIGISLVPYKKAEKWSWWILLIIGIVPFIGWAFAVQGVAEWVSMMIGWVLFILAIAIPAKAILGGKAREK